MDNSLPIQDLRITEETKTTSPREEFRSVSTKVIAYPLTDKLNTKYDSIESGEYRWPDVLALGLFQSCHHGNRVCEDDPIENGWIRCKNATIYRNGSASAQRTVCYRPTVNGCCTVDFDGQDGLLFNLDNKNILLFGYMHSFVESGTPFAACFRTRLLTSQVMSNQLSAPLHTLRKVWNSFARILDIDFSSIFICRQCGPNP